ncbi:MAG TPA: type II toxin-antitoxin system PemK/MazF family toxin [Planctomycetaceae bacterium]
MIRRGDIWWADLPKPVGSGPGYRRPVLIVQSDDFTRSSIRTVIAVVLTTNLRLEAAPGNVRLTARNTGLPKDSVANVSQIVTIDERLLTNHVGQLPGLLMRRVEEGLRLVLEL